MIKIIKQITGPYHILAAPSTATFAINADMKSIPKATYAHSLTLLGKYGSISIKPPMNFPMLSSQWNHIGRPRCLVPSRAILLAAKNIPGSIKMASNMVLIQ